LLGINKSKHINRKVMAGVNKAILVGNLGKDPEIRALDSGVKVATFSIATTETYKDKEGKRVDSTEWHNVVLWRGLAEIAEKYLKKGNSVYVEGRIKTRSWDDKDGNKRYTTEIVGDTMNMLGGKPGQGNSGDPGPAVVNEPTGPAASPDDDLPF
jgi:single-strand DNA-binding protein